MQLIEIPHSASTRRKPSRTSAGAARSPMDEAQASATVARGNAAASEAIDAAQAAAVILRIIEKTPFDIADTIGLPALLVAKRLVVTANALATTEADPDWDEKNRGREKASYALKGAAGLVSLLQTNRPADCIFMEGLLQIEQELLDRAQDLLDVS